MTDTLPKPEPDDDDEDLPITLPATATPSRFGPAAIDLTLNRQLQDLIPKTANTATVTVRLKGQDGERILTGVVATRIGENWGLAVAGALDLDDQRNYELEFLGVVSWS